MRQLAGIACALAFVLAAGVSHAQDAWPSRTITFIVPYAAGGYTDLVGRMTARYVEAGIGQDRRRRRPRRRRRHRRHAGRRQCGARRLHLLRLQHRRHLDRALHPEGRLRPGPRPRADRHREPDRAGRHRQEGPAGEDDRRARGLRQGSSRQAQLRLERRRRPHPLCGGAVPDAHRNERRAHSLQGRRAVDGRGDRGRGRFLLRQPDRRLAAGRGRRGARARRHLAASAAAISPICRPCTKPCCRTSSSRAGTASWRRRRRRHRSSAGCRRSCSRWPTIPP